MQRAGYPLRTSQSGRTLLRRGHAGLGFGQLFALIFGFLVTSALIFLFGIWVGRDVAERRLAQEERVVRVPIPVQPTASEETKEPDVDLAFYEKLKEEALRRLQETAAVSASPTPLPAAPVANVQPPPARAAERRRLPTPAINIGRYRTEPQKNEWADAGWTVQVNATTNPQQATELARTLRSKGYNAYTVQAPMRGQTWYRVRVGRFSSRDKAKELESRLKTVEGMENAYVTAQ